MGSWSSRARRRRGLWLGRPGAAVSPDAADSRVEDEAHRPGRQRGGRGRARSPERGSGADKVQMARKSGADETALGLSAPGVLRASRARGCRSASADLAPPPKRTEPLGLQPRVRITPPPPPRPRLAARPCVWHRYFEKLVPLRNAGLRRGRSGDGRGREAEASPVGERGAGRPGFAPPRRGTPAAGGSRAAPFRLLSASGPRAPWSGREPPNARPRRWPRLGLGSPPPVVVVTSALFPYL